LSFFSVALILLSFFRYSRHAVRVCHYVSGHFCRPEYLQKCITSFTKSKHKIFYGWFQDEIRGAFGDLAAMSGSQLLSYWTLGYGKPIWAYGSVKILPYVTV